MKTHPMLSNWITIGNFLCGIMSIYFSAQDKVVVAAYMIFVAMIFDFLDGRVARLTQTVSDLGSQLDSLADLVSFGIAPMILVSTVFYQHQGSGGWLPGILYAGCGMMRLAKYNIQARSETKKDFFNGLPIPAAAGFVTSVILAYLYSNKQIILAFTPLLMILAALLMVSNVAYLSPSRMEFKKLPAAIIIVLCFAAIVFLRHWYLLLLAGFFGYVFGGGLLHFTANTNFLKSKE